MLSLPAGVKPVASHDGIDSVTVEQAIERMKEGMRKEGLLRDTKITWQRADVRDRSGNKIGQLGEFNKYLPYVRVPGYSATFSRFYYIQNAKIMKANGTPTSLEEILRLDPQAHDLVDRAYKTFMEQAVASDPMLCKYCKTHSSASVDDAQRHLVLNHADVVEDMLKVASPATAEPSFPCDMCDKIFPKKQAMVMHRRIKHKATEKIL